VKITKNMIHTFIDVPGLTVRLETTPDGLIRVGATFGSGASVANFITYVPPVDFAHGAR
jgi:hypothetical protein